jgi:uncharacterized glyoxalase superfamily protein PhnB
MSSTPRPAGISWLSPYLIVTDVEVAATFYQNAFGFDLKELASGENGEVWHAELFYKDQFIMIGKNGGWCNNPPPAVTGVESPMSLYLYCEDVDAFYAKAIAAGAVSVSAPEDAFWGDRMCRLKDPDGFDWSFATFSGERK